MLIATRGRNWRPIRATMSPDMAESEPPDSGEAA